MLRVRSSKSNFEVSKYSRQSSRALDDPMESFDYLYKFIVIGDEQVGKSNLLNRITKGKFVQKPRTTYGVEFEWVNVPLPGTN